MSDDTRTLVERVEDLEKALAAITLPPTLAQLTRKLEASWQPSANVLLEPGSITPDLLADDAVPTDIYGSVNGTTGAKIRGHGFTSTRTAAGAYSITFDRPLAAHPNPTFGLYNNGNVMGIACTLTSTTGMSISTYVSNTGVPTDCDFSFSITEDRT